MMNYAATRHTRVKSLPLTAIDNSGYRLAIHTKFPDTNSDSNSQNTSRYRGYEKNARQSGCRTSMKGR